MRQSNTEDTKIVTAGNALLDMARYEPVRFQREILGIQVDPWQAEGTDAVFDVVRKRYGKPTLINHEGKRFFTVRAMHGPGKTFWLGSLIITFGFAFPKCRIPCIAPKMDQLKTRLWLELRKIRDLMNPDLRDSLEINSTTMKFFGYDDWRAFGQTATKSENLAGLHHDFILVCVDEASGVPEFLWPAIFGAVSTGAIPILVMISNPTKNTGTFAESWMKSGVKEKYHQVAITLDKAPRVSTEWVESMRQKYGEKSPIFKIRCLGEFADAGENQLIPLQKILDSLMSEDSEGDGSLPVLRVSVDVADGGENESVVTVARHFDSFEEIIAVRRYSFPAAESPILTAQAAEQVFFGFGGVKGQDELIVDALGVGAGTAGYLIQEEHRVIAYRGGEGSDDSKKWRNRRAQSYINLRDAFRDGRIRVRHSAFESDKDREDFIAQLCLIERKPGDDRVEELVSKQELMRKGIKSPDIADSLAMQYATQFPTLQSKDSHDLPEIHIVESDIWRTYPG